ncbi:DUF3325 domain-containing protein [Roseococcus pinisoli]|uniref:DUF3325 domain-containing protein n=1 Tax=Roseococcus pinisoli TaxID=2835040 RepID=A0ABS5QB08_9PROT|nr:DUF3325 domain-containing protein [Roseococcus pinisoli]MBS7810431.1 DUF3325 domain-containing protein [Roseococcus pinisoli]
MILLSFALAYAGFLALCLSLDRHHQEVIGGRPKPPRVQALRIAGWALLVLSFGAGVTAWGWIMGPVGWIGLLTASALPLAFLLPYAPRVALALGPALPGAAICVLFVSALI